MINILNATPSMCHGDILLTFFPVEYVVIGNHEFDFGAEVATEMANKSKFKWFGTNVLKTDSNDLMDGLIRKKIIQMGDFKVGLFGVCTPETVSLRYICLCTCHICSRPGPAIRFTPVIETTKTIVDELRTKDKCDVIVALTHLSVPEDRELARCVSGIDVQLGGHDVIFYFHNDNFFSTLLILNSKVPHLFTRLAMIAIGLRELIWLLRSVPPCLLVSKLLIPRFSLNGTWYVVIKLFTLDFESPY